MARARNIKPGFFANEDLAECNPLARILFAGLWCLADREGRLEDRPKRIRAELLPYDNCDADQLLDELQTHGFITRYECGENRYIQVLNFCKHQNPHIKEAKSSIPAPDNHEQAPEEHSASTVQAPEEHHTSPADSLIPDSLIPEEEHVDADASTPAAPSDRQTGQLLQLDRIPYEKIRELYNQILGGKLKRCLGVTETHRKHIRAAYNLKLDDTFPVRDGGLQFWEGLFHDVLECPFMLGDNNRSWRADFEFLTTGSKIQRFMEGKYDAA